MEVGTQKPLNLTVLIHWDLLSKLLCAGLLFISSSSFSPTNLSQVHVYEWFRFVQFLNNSHISCRLSINVSIDSYLRHEIIFSFLKNSKSRRTITNLQWPFHYALSCNKSTLHKIVIKFLRTAFSSYNFFFFNSNWYIVIEQWSFEFSHNISCQLFENVKSLQLNGII